MGHVEVAQKLTKRYSFSLTSLTTPVLLAAPQEQAQTQIN